MPHKLSRELCKPETRQVFSVDGKEFYLGGHLGDGAVGVVRRAIRLADNKEFAVKFLAPDSKYIDEDVFDDVSVRFRREGERGANLDHSHLISIFNYLENRDGDCFEKAEVKNPFLLMELIKGKTLESYIKRVIEAEKNIFSVSRERLNIAIQIVFGLQNLHKRNLIHRDIKPANIFLSNLIDTEYPLVKLGDFGVMKWGDFHASMTTGTLTVTNQKPLGTMKYMSPELAISPKDVTVRSDIYSLGITLFELFIGNILLSAHHVYSIREARQARGNTLSRYNSIGYKVSGQDEEIAEILLEMFRASSGRPSIDKILGNFEYEYETRYDTTWDADLYDK